MSDETTSLIIIRHGETEWNTEGRIQGCLDSPLTKKGLDQAELTGQRLRRLSIDSLVCSHLGRAEITARIIGKQTGHSPYIHEGLEERRFGKLESLTRAEAQDRLHPTIVERLYRDEFCEEFGAESLIQLRDRMMAALREIAEREKGKTTAIMTHGGCLHVAFKEIVGIPLGHPRKFSIKNCSINRLSFNGEWAVDLWGDTSHLDDSADEA